MSHKQPAPRIHGRRFIVLGYFSRVVRGRDTDSQFVVLLDNEPIPYAVTEAASHRGRESSGPGGGDS